MPDDPGAFPLRVAEEHVDAQAIRIARQLRHSRRRSVGLLPASDDVVVWPAALQLGMALQQVTADRVALVDTEQRWPEIEALFDGVMPANEHAFMSLQPLSAWLMLASPHRPAPEGAKVQLLQVMLQEIDAASPPFAHVVLDLTGFYERKGEFLAAMDSSDGILVVARAGSTVETSLLALDREVPPTLNLGVLLVQ